MAVNYNPEDVQKTIDKHVEAGNLHTGWEELWAQGDSITLPWDKHKPNPTLEEVLTTKRAIIGGPLAYSTEGDFFGSKTRKKALVPGCGRGADVLLLASFGYDAYGLEYSRSAIENCRQEEQAAEQKYPVRDAEIGKGTVSWVQGDFFEEGWLEGLGLSRNSFDFIYDYTVSFLTSGTYRDLMGASSFAHYLPHCARLGLYGTHSSWPLRRRATWSVSSFRGTRIPYSTAPHTAAHLRPIWSI
jgi:SAM-dependent methyltransferase